MQQAEHGSMSEVPDELELRVFTLADHAVVPPDGKLYMNGGGVDQMYLPEIPGTLGSLSLAIRVRIPWRMTSELLHVQVRALSDDREPVGPDPVLDANAEVGRPPGLRPGDENCLALAIPLTGFPVEREGTINFHLNLGDRLLGVLPLKIRRVLIAQVGLAQPH